MTLRGNNKLRVIHICLANFYIDNFSYQENVLPRMHKRQGHDVVILASTETLLPTNELSYLKPSTYVNNDGITVIRLPYVKWLPGKIAKKLRIYPGVYNVLSQFEPDFIFIHDVQFLSIRAIKKYKINNFNVKVVADGHADYFNSATCFISKKILHGILYRLAIQNITPFVDKFFGTLPSRVSFFNEMYGIPIGKIHFLPMGADDELVQNAKSDGSRDIIRKQLGFGKDDVVFVTGGKFDKRKKSIFELMDAVSLMGENVKLIIFGSISSEQKETFDKKLIRNKIIMLGWLDEKKIIKFLTLETLRFFLFCIRLFGSKVPESGCLVF